MRTLKFGTLMGEDAQGTKYYENTKVRGAARPCALAARARGTAATPSSHGSLPTLPRRRITH